MVQDLQVRLSAATKRLRERRKLERDLQKVRETLLVERGQSKELHGRLQKEEADVKKLEGLSLTALFHAILGSKQERLSEERKEFMAVKLRYDDILAAIEELEANEKNLTQQLAEYDDAETTYASLLAEKEQAISKSGGAAARGLLELSEAIADARSDIKETQEAIQAAKDVRHALMRLSGALGRAESWGVADMLGGGLFATAIKHSKLDDARSLARRVQHHLRRLDRELADVRQATSVHVEVDIGGLGFADWFFDGLLVDWLVQKRINASHAKVRDAERQIDRLTRSLHKRRESQETRVAELEKQRRELIEGA